MPHDSPRPWGQIATIVMGVTLALQACQCADDTSSLPVPLADAADLMSDPDSGTMSCVRAETCPGPFPPCESGNCGCGNFRLCNAGLCRAVAVECRHDASSDPDSGAPDASLDPNDASRDPIDASSPMSCTTAGDCRGPAPPSLNLCPSSRYSCLDGVCVWECQGPRSCTRASDDCAICGMDRACPRRNCPIESAVAVIEETTAGCEFFPGTTRPFRGAMVRVDSTARPCSRQITLDGAPSNISSFLDYDDGTYWGFFPDFGLHCTGVQAPTGAIQVIFSCPRCQFMMRL